MTKLLGLKVLDENMRSCNGDHLTFKPQEWFTQNNRVFLAEAEASEVGEQQRDKFVCRSVKLLKELTSIELARYAEAIAPVENAYYESVETAEKAYAEAVATARKDFDEATETAENAFDEAIAPAEKAYAEATETARKARGESIATARKAYEEAIQKILEGFLPQ